MNHISQDDLILQYYDESPGELDVAGHLAECDDCRAESEALRKVLSAIDQLEIPDRDESYEQRLWERLRWRLRERVGSRLRKLAPLGAVAAMLALAFLAGQISRRPSQAPAPGKLARVESGEKSRERIFFVVVADHLDSSHRMLLELSNVQGSESRDISIEQEFAEDLVESNRLYRQTAAADEDPGVTAVLEELEPILLEIAHGPSTLSADALANLQKRIESKGMLLKLRVIGSKVREREVIGLPSRAAAKT